MKRDEPEMQANEMKFLVGVIGKARTYRIINTYIAKSLRWNYRIKLKRIRVRLFGCVKDWMSMEYHKDIGSEF
jgi:hypothetical protein